MTAWAPRLAMAAAASIIGAICRDGADLLVRRDLTYQVGQHVRAALGPMALALTIANVAIGDLDGPDLHRRLVDAQVDLAPNAPTGTAMLAGMRPPLGP